ncbi:hypothetical protein KIW84_065451 [Lathyrus oleraceus]|uniref:Uncharacterized protein n=1 Tax=Pisum sativum TaxID=3888 RepID=A0A9D5A9S3_PEA|nr:hypothetical protein KIW84_065451 [Pisum sativum]
MRRLLTLVYRGDSKPKRTLRLLNIFQATGHLLVSLPPVLVFGKFEGYFEEEPVEEERFMTDNDIIGISNDMARDISYYDVFDLNSMNTGVIRPTNTYQWPVTRLGFVSTQKKPIGAREVTKTTSLATQVSQINQMVKNMFMSPDVLVVEPFKVVTDTSEVACVYCEGDYLFEDCSTNLVSMNYVENKKYNTYNPTWSYHPNFSWSNRQNQLKPQAPQDPPSFSASNHDIANQGNNQLENISNTYQWPVTRLGFVSTQKKPVGAREVTKTTSLATQVAQINQMVKNMFMSPDVLVVEPFKVVTDTSEVACVYYEGDYIFEDCSTNLVFMNYVGNKKYNNTYNPRWSNHPNFSWSNRQNQLKPQAPQVPPSFSASNHDIANLGNNQLENIFKSFVQETNNQFKSQGVSIKILENQVGHIVLALSSRTLGALSSSTETPAYASGTKGIETYKVIKLRSRKECEGSTQPREDPPRVILNTPDTSEEVESDPIEKTSLEEPVKEKLQNE